MNLIALPIYDRKNLTSETRETIRNNPNVALTVYARGGHGMKAGFAGLLGDTLPGRVAEFLVCMSDPAARVESAFSKYSVLATLPLFVAFMTGAHMVNRASLGVTQIT